MKLTSTIFLFCVLHFASTSDALAEFRAGVAVVDVTPTQFPVLVNDGMTSRSADKVITPITARAIVLDDGQERLGIVVVDSCMMPHPLLDEAKALAAQRTKIRPDRIADDPFGNATVRANMHAGSNWDDVTGESGPEDPDLSLISLQAKNGRPIAVLANLFHALLRWSAGVERGLLRAVLRRIAVTDCHVAGRPLSAVRRRHVPRLQWRYLAT